MSIEIDLFMIRLMHMKRHLEFSSFQRATDS